MVKGVVSPLGGKKLKLLKTLEARKLKDRWLREMGYEWVLGEELQDIEYWCDEESGLRFFSPSWLEGDSTLYRHLQKERWYYEFDKWEFQSALDIILQEKGDCKDFRVLEIGCGTGEFMEKCVESELEVVGLEINEDARKELTGRKMTVYEDFEQVNDDESLFNVVAAFQVIEHLSDPVGLLERMISMAKPHALIVIAVPNSEMNLRISQGRHELLNMPPHHMAHWTKKALVYLENVLPVKLEKVVEEPIKDCREHWEWLLWSVGDGLEAIVGSCLRRLVVNRYSISAWIVLLRPFRKFIPYKSRLVVWRVLR